MVSSGLGLIPILVLALAFLPTSTQSTCSNYYKDSCPGAEAIIQAIVEHAIEDDKKIAPAMLRMFFHDCIVNGCDAGILIDSTHDNEAEKDAKPNDTIVDFDLLDFIKAALEKICKKTVSCADILAYSAATSVAALGGPKVDIEGGRFDSLISRKADTVAQIPSPQSNLSTLKAAFATKGLNAADLVVLSGAHTIGHSHCISFLPRLRNFSKTAADDPRLDPVFANILKKQCPANDPFPKKLLDMDKTPEIFDNNYFRRLPRGDVMFQSDSALYGKGVTRRLVDDFAAHGDHFADSFGRSLYKMGQINLKSEKEGNIRTNCRTIA